MKYSKRAIEKFLKGKLSSDPRWALRALVRIYERQTPDEKVKHETEESNGIGFTGFDARILSSLAKQYMKHHILTISQIEVVRNKIPKYWRQLIDIAGGYDKFIPFMEAENGE